MDKFLNTIERIESIRLSNFEFSVKGSRKRMNILDFEQWYDSRVTILNETLVKLTTVLYKNSGSGFVNIDNITGRILIPLPWGSVGYRRWELKSNEGAVFKRIMLVRSEIKKPPPLFDYNPESKNWFINHQLYPTIEYGLNYVKVHPVTMKEFTIQYNAYKTYTREKVERHGKKANK